MTDPNQIKDLSQGEKVQVEARAYKAFLAQAEIYNPPPTPDGTDLIHENRRVMNVLTNLVGWLPALFAFVLAGATIVSLDKTAAAFEASVAHKDGLFGAWTYIVAIAAIVMCDVALVISEFAAVRDTLSKNLRREVFTLKRVMRGWRVFVGKEQPRDWHEMPDPTLAFYSKFLFWLVIAANVYAVTRTANINSLSDIGFEEFLLLFTGVAGALSLRLVGRQVAHIVYELAKKRENLEAREMREEWRQEMTDLWREQGPHIIAEAMHQKFLSKNHLPLDAGSPYLLMAGENEGGEPTVSAVPLAQSPQNSPAMSGRKLPKASQPISQNGTDQE